jgi:dTDP-4-dehydrorhamnose 3,5-epimerase-like enzyme
MKNPLNTTIDDVRVIALNQVFTEGSGAIVFCEESAQMPFAPARVFYLYDIPAGESRGAHAHKECHQLLVAVSGSFEVVTFDGNSESIYCLNQPNQGLHIPPGIWAAEVNFSGGAICLVLASEKYLESDYIRLKEDFIIWKLDSHEV